MRRIKTSDVIIGAIVLVLVGLLVYRLTRPKTTPITIPQITQTEQELENKFKVNIPDNIEKAELRDVSGGTGSGLATRSEILADLPEPPAGQFYQGWLEKNGRLVSLGKLRVAKGGWLVEYDAGNYPGYDKVIVSQEKVFDGKLETRVLEGSFK